MTGTVTQPCGHCRQPVPAAPGRAPGQTWWHTDRPECLEGRRRRPPRRVQPCGHCGDPIESTPGRRPGETWWHTDRPECLDGRWHANHPRKPRSTQPCGHCGRPVNSTRGRHPGLTWWHLNEECRRGQNREAKAASRARAADRTAERAA